jgi:hypothetical protein
MARGHKFGKCAEACDDGWPRTSHGFDDGKAKGLHEVIVGGHGHIAVGPKLFDVVDPATEVNAVLDPQ